MEDHLYIKIKEEIMKESNELKQNNSIDISKTNQLDQKKQKKIQRSKNYTCSVISSAITVNALHDENLDLPTVLDELIKINFSVVDGKTVEIKLMLMTQAKTLDILFNKMLVKATNSELMIHFEKFMEIALKAQNQSRQVLSTLCELNHPRRSTFIKQQNNNAHNQQINNGCADNFSKKPDNLANELLKEKSNEKLDIGSSSKTITLNQSMATMDQING